MDIARLIRAADAMMTALAWLIAGQRRRTGPG